MRAHLDDLRAEVGELAEGERERLLADLAEDWRRAALGEADRALCAFAEKLTRAPASMVAADVEALRAAGLEDVAVHDAVQVVSYFNYVNRVADGLDVEPEPGMPPRPRR